MAPPSLLADEMLGRLARYLRMLGCDTVYARGWTDDEIARRAREEGRVVLTRDRALASRASSAVLLDAVDLPHQLEQVFRDLPGLPRSVAFRRCTLCNGELEPAAAGPGPVAGGTAGSASIYACRSCGHRYWEGSHTADVRRHLAEWIPGPRA